MDINDYLSRSEIRALLKKSDLRGAWEVITTWGLIAAAFSLAALWTNPLTVLAAIVILGNRHLALSILVHDAGHHALFKTRWLNDVIGQWLCAAPELLDLKDYRHYHTQHHKYTGMDYKDSTGDPDIILTRNYPISRKGLIRWFLRDFTLRSAPRLYLGLLAMRLRIIRFDLSGRVTRLPRAERNFMGQIFFGLRQLFPFLITNGLLFLVLYLSGHGWLFLLWIFSAMTLFQAFTRLRSIAEHGMLPRVEDRFKNTRTTLTSWWERITFAPHHVNYHLEHHLLMGAPSYRLPRLHQVLSERGALLGAPIASGYKEVLRLAIR